MSDNNFRWPCPEHCPEPSLHDNLSVVLAVVRRAVATFGADAVLRADLDAWAWSMSADPGDRRAISAQLDLAVNHVREALEKQR